MPVHHARLRRAAAWLTGAVLSTASVALLAAAQAAPATAATGDYSCTGGTIYGISTTTLYRIDTATGAATSLGTFSKIDMNGLAISDGGADAYAAGKPDADGLVSLQKFNLSAGTSSEVASVSTSLTNLRAAGIDPTTNTYWFGGDDADGTHFSVYSVNLATGVSNGERFQVLEGGGGPNADLAFDASGRMYLVMANGTAAGNRLLMFTPAELAAGGTQTGTLLAHVAPTSSAFPGIAFASNGYLYTYTGGTLYKTNPSDGSVVATISTQSGMDDLGSCASPVSLQVGASVDARAASTDQFTVTINGDNGLTATSGTTTGTDTGAQDDPGETAGPVLVLPGSTYTFAQTAAGTTDLSDYTTTWQCKAGSTVVASGAGNSGSFTAPASGTDPISCGFANELKQPSVSIVTNASGSPTKAGDHITYSFDVTNDGNQPLTDVGVSAGLLTGDAITCAATSLAAGATTQCTAAQPYVVTQADVDAGHVDITGTVAGTAPSGAAGAVTASDPATTTIESTPAITTTLAATGSPAKAGDHITYTATVKNGGNVTLHSVDVTDALGNGYTCSPTSLAPGASATCTATYSVTQADVDAGTVDDTATGKGLSPTSAQVTDAAPATSTAIVADGDIDLELAGSGTPAKAGDQITYTGTVTNTGNVTLSHVAVTGSLGDAFTCPATTLAPLARTTCTATHTVTQAEADAGHVALSASVIGTDPGEHTHGDTDAVSTSVDSAAALTITGAQAQSLVDVDGDGRDSAGDTVVRVFTVKNTGSTTVSQVALTDDLASSITCAPTSLAPGESATCTSAPTAVTQAQIDAGEAVDAATASGASGSDPVSSGRSDDVTTPLTRAPSVAIVISAHQVKDANGDGKLNKGDTVSYSFEVTNTGNTTASDLSVSDERLADPDVTCSPDPLAPGAKAACVTDAVHTIDSDDVDARKVTDAAVVTATSGGSDVTADSNTVVSKVVPNPQLTIVTHQTTRDANDDGSLGEGDQVRFTYTVTNTGDITLDGVTVHDPVVDDAGITITCSPTTLKPGEKATCVTSKAYTLAAGETRLVSRATATGTDPVTGDAVDDNGVVKTVVSKVSAPAASQSGDTDTSGSVLPNTGGPRLAAGALGLAALTAGGVLVGRSRRRRARA